MLDFALDNRIFIESESDAAVQELDIMFNTESMELLGYPDYGVNMEQFLWTLTPTTTALTEYINQKLSETFFVSKMKYDVNVNFLSGEFRSIYQIRIDLYTNDNQFLTTKTYQFQ